MELNLARFLVSSLLRWLSPPKELPLQFHPPFCPNPECFNHQPHCTSDTWWKSIGFFLTRHSGKVPRYQCLSCSRTCSRSTFQVEFRAKYRMDLPRIAHSLNSGEGLRSLARAFGVRENTISNRISRLARQALALSARLRLALRLKENLVADGLESFTWSHYFPNNFTVLIGKQSQYFYGVDYSVMKRKGKMTKGQWERRAQLDQKAVIPTHSLNDSIHRILRLQNDLWESSRKRTLTLYTDDHPSYHRCIVQNQELKLRMAEKRFIHCQTSSQRARTLENPLMSVNYFDREVRKDQANHGRQTVQWSKEANSSMERMWLYGVMHNCFKPQRIKGSVVNLGDWKTHAQVAGIPKRLLTGERKKFFVQRAFYSQESKYLNESEWRTWMKTWPNPLRQIAPMVWPCMVA